MGDIEQRSTRPAPSGVCVFCGSNGPMTDEHAFQQWARKLLGVSRRGRVRVMRGIEHMRTARGLNLIAEQSLCEPCNSAWLAGYEDRFKKLLGPAIIGKGPITLNAEEQEFASVWVIKTALLLELAARYDRPAIRVPVSAFHWLHTHKTPPPGSAVWLGTTGPRAGEPPRVGYFANQVVASTTRDGEMANIITFVVGNLLLKCIVPDVPDDGSYIATPIADSPQMIQIRPVVKDPVTWPPQPVSYDALDTPEFMFAPVRVPEAHVKPLPADFQWPNGYR